MAGNRTIWQAPNTESYRADQDTTVAMHVLMLTLRVDRKDWLVGFTHTWLERLAPHPQIERISVICLERGEVDLPENVQVYSMGKERGAGRIGQLMNFHRAIAPIIREVDVVFGHLVPRYTLIAAPYALRHHIPMVHWHTHKS